VLDDESLFTLTQLLEPLARAAAHEIPYPNAMALGRL
jgi:hypothetical protein